MTSATPTTPTVSKQSIASVLRQVLAVATSVYGVLTASIGSLHLPVAASTALISFGPVLLSIEHFVADPSTGSTAGSSAASTASSSPAKPTLPPA